jgi:hypothetical protein
MSIPSKLQLPGNALPVSKMPGHWLLARLGKRVLRPGGLGLTRSMLDALAIQTCDEVVEFAPGLGVTARMTLGLRPCSYTAVEEDSAAAAKVSLLLAGPRQRCVIGSAAESGLPGESATRVYGEAMLSMQGAEQKRRIVAEAFRLLKPAGRYGIHELCLLPGDLDHGTREEIQQALSRAIHVGARPLTSVEWHALLEGEGFTVHAEATRPMRLLEPDRLIQDEGLWGTLKFGWNLLHDRDARRRVLEMRRVFLNYRSHLAAIMLVGTKRTG